MTHRSPACTDRPGDFLHDAPAVVEGRWNHVGGGGGGGRGSGGVSGPAQSERAAGLQGASQSPQRLLRRRRLLLPLLLASFTLPAAAQPLTPGAGGAAPAAAPPLLPRGRWRGRRLRAGALAGSRLRAAAAAHDQEAAAPTGRRWRRRRRQQGRRRHSSRAPGTRASASPRAHPSAPPALPPPGARPRAESRPVAAHPARPASARETPRPGLRGPGGHPRRGRGEPNPPADPLAPPPSEGRGLGRVRRKRRAARPPAAAAAAAAAAYPYATSREGDTVLRTRGRTSSRRSGAPPPLSPPAPAPAPAPPTRARPLAWRAPTGPAAPCRPSLRPERGCRPGRLEREKVVCTHTHTHTHTHNTTQHDASISLRSSSSCFLCRRLGFGVCLLVVAFAPLGRAAVCKSALGTGVPSSRLGRRPARSTRS
ncbi:translation initiation factor IF-2-like [Leopardus geoffroyi]|uniref:translation initiation factor IF-2-like n=1 Tax=Leopardus geoffroyi TaxID=46844 RepID=UPI001E2617BB|nr:translation initiation factor IF-2-like [Leopardus geoffroyi]